MHEKGPIERLWRVFLLLQSDFTHLRRHIGLHRFLFLTSLHRSPCTILSGRRLPVRYDLGVFLRTIRSRFFLVYDINLGATTTTILSTRGVQIPIYLVTSATDSFRRSVVLFKSLSIPTSDLKSEFLCQSSYLHRTCRPPEPPCTSGISPTPSSPRIILTGIILTVTVQVLLPSTLSRGSVYNGPNDLVVAFQLKSSRAFSPNVTLMLKNELIQGHWQLFSWTMLSPLVVITHFLHV